MAVKNEVAINTIKMLAIDMMQNAKCGYQNMDFGIINPLYALYANELNILPKNPNWINRDRFIFSIGCGSALLYSLLYYSDYSYSIDDLKRFCITDSYTPYYPELNIQLGIESSTIGNGEGISHGVGICLAQRYYDSIIKSVTPKSKLLDFNTYVLCGDDDFKEGISYESLTIAAKEKLGKLIILYYAKEEMTEDIEVRLEALDIDTIFVKNNINEISSAIRSAKKSDMPSVIVIESNKKDKNKIPTDNFKFNEIMTAEDVLKLKEKYGIKYEPFEEYPEVRNFISNLIIGRVNKKYENWYKEYSSAKESRNKDLINIINLIEKGEFYVDFDSTYYQINEKYVEEGNISNRRVVNFIAPKTRYLVGGSSILNENIIDKSGEMTFDNPSGRNLTFVKREKAMAGIMIGMSLMGLRTFVNASLVDVDQIKREIRSSAFMKLPITYIFSDDSINIGEKGPLLEPSEQISSLRLIPNLNVFRPADINEIIGSWEYILKNKGTNAIILSNERLNILKHSNGKYVKYGAYIVRKEKYRLDGIIIATGSEVKIALKIAGELYTQGIDIRVVTMPNMELFLKQNELYEEKLLPKDVKTITLEAGNTLLWNRFATNKDYTIGINNFGVSGKKDEILRFMEFDYNTILMKVKNILSNEEVNEVKENNDYYE